MELIQQCQFLTSPFVLQNVVVRMNTFLFPADTMMSVKCVLYNVPPIEIPVEVRSK